MNRIALSVIVLVIVLCAGIFVGSWYEKSATRANFTISVLRAKQLSVEQKYPDAISEVLSFAQSDVDSWMQSETLADALACMGESSSATIFYGAAQRLRVVSGGKADALIAAKAANPHCPK